MSRTSLISSRRRRAACRPAPDTRLLHIPFPDTVSPSHPVDPLRVSPKTSAPSRPTPHRTVGSRGIAPRKISRTAPLGAEAGLRGIAPRKISRSAPPGVEAGLRGIAPRKISCSAPLGAEAGPRGIAPRKISCSAPPGAEAGPPRHCAASVLPRPVPGRRGSAGNPHPLPIPVSLPQGRRPVALA